MFEVITGPCSGCGVPVQTYKTYGGPVFRCRDCEVKDAIKKIKEVREEWCDPDNLYSESCTLIAAIRDWGYTLVKEEP